jgi:hypothetical protein
MEWIHLSQDVNWWQALVNTVMHLWVLAPQSFPNFRFAIYATVMFMA